MKILNEVTEAKVKYFYLFCITFSKKYIFCYKSSFLLKNYSGLCSYICIFETYKPSLCLYFNTIPDGASIFNVLRLVSRSWIPSTPSPSIDANVDLLESSDAELMILG